MTALKVQAWMMVRVSNSQKEPSIYAKPTLYCTCTGKHRETEIFKRKLNMRTFAATITINLLPCSQGFGRLSYQQSSATHSMIGRKCRCGSRWLAASQTYTLVLQVASFGLARTSLPRVVLWHGHRKKAASTNTPCFFVMHGNNTWAAQRQAHVALFDLPLRGHLPHSSHIAALPEFNLASLQCQTLPGPP